ncbi:MAG: hypothetical protein RBT11_17805 [Desulfobacterales bacterium]|jgi:hypothetical protein|nr:hypothetical protein [Desulfobacterales bacterium]
MDSTPHTFHIPVMGTGHSADTPIRLAHFGISSVISIVDDLLLERLGKYYSEKYEVLYPPIPRNAVDGRSRRITAYLNLVLDIVERHMEKIKSEPFFQDNDKRKYFDMLPDEAPLKKDYDRMLAMKSGTEKDRLAAALTDQMRAGSIDVNIMVKLDRPRFDENGMPMEDYSDAKTALKGFANSRLNSGIVFSAGINKGLFRYMSRFKDFYRDETGRMNKRIILKVSDFRSSLIQGRFLAQHGLEISEYRIESGLNCGGHAFASNGVLLPAILREYKENRAKLGTDFQSLILKHYQKMGWFYPDPSTISPPIVTVQGGIGNHGEDRRLREYFGMDRTGWGTPFLLVPEATCVDAETRELMRRAGKNDLYLSDISPLGVPFNLVRNTGSVNWTRNKIACGKPGSGCPKGFLALNTELTEKPICPASREFQTMKLKKIVSDCESDAEKAALSTTVLEKTCLCDHLGNGILIGLGIADKKKSPPLVCPGPNLAWFNGIYSLREMVNHIYGRCPSLVPAERPHMFANEIVMYVDYFEKLIQGAGNEAREIKALQDYKANLEQGMDLCLAISKGSEYPGENMASVAPCVETQRARLNRIWRCAGFDCGRACDESGEPLVVAC